MSIELRAHHPALRGAIEPAERGSRVRVELSPSVTTTITWVAFLAWLGIIFVVAISHGISVASAVLFLGVALVGAVFVMGVASDLASNERDGLLDIIRQTVEAPVAAKSEVDGTQARKPPASER